MADVGQPYGDVMTKDDLLPLLEANLARQLQWIGAADTKATFAFTLVTAMLGVLAAIAPRSPAEWTVTPAVFASLAALLGVVALLFVSFASFPRTKGPPGSLVYCGGVARRSASEFKGAVDSLSVEEYVADLASQCHRNAEIAMQKFVWVQRALLCLYISVLPWALTLWLLYNSISTPELSE